jgi:type II secretory pathway pseudopilin PulG
LVRYSINRSDRERGYVLLAILFALTLLVIALSVAAPNAAKAIQRQKEDELIRRGEQYSLAIRRFYKKFGRYPSDLDQLENTNNIRFLRRKYLDPITGKDDWQPIQFGQARPPTGFFGQKITTTGGLSPSGAGIGPSTIGTGLGPTGATSSSSASNVPASGQNTPLGTPGAAGAASPSSAANSSAGPGAANSPAGPTGSAGNPLSTDQLSGKSFGGGAVVGVSIPSQKESLKEFQQKNHYNEWQFVYDPTMDPTSRGGLGAGAATGMPGATGLPGTNPPGTNPSGFGQPSNPTSPTTTPPSPNPAGAGTTPSFPR